MIGGGLQGAVTQASQAGFDDTPGAIDLDLERVDPNGLSGARVKAWILLAGGWETTESNQCRAKGLWVLVGSQGAPNEINSGSGDGVPSKLCPKNHTGCGVDPESRPFWRLERSSLGHQNSLRRIDDVLSATSCG